MGGLIQSAPAELQDTASGFCEAWYPHIGIYIKVNRIAWLHNQQYYYTLWLSQQQLSLTNDVTEIHVN